MSNKPTVLFVGGTGNTGQNAVRTFVSLAPKDKYRILLLTRSASSGSAKALGELPGVEIEEKDWTYVDTAYLKKNNVERVFVASHNGPSHFYDESSLLYNCLAAGVKYVVRISTSTFSIAPARAINYGRAHWAIETALDQPEYEKMAWTSLRPNVFYAFTLMSAIEWIKNYKKTGKGGPLKLTNAKDASVAIVDAEDVGKIAGTLLAQDDYASHSQQRYIVTGPEDLTGADIVKIIEKISGGKVDDVEYGYVPVDEFIKSGMMPSNQEGTLRQVIEDSQTGMYRLENNSTSEALLKLAAPSTTAEQWLRSAI